jgi:hypothetical protein
MDGEPAGAGEKRFGVLQTVKPFVHHLDIPGYLCELFQCLRERFMVEAESGDSQHQKESVSWRPINMLIRCVGEEINQGPTGYDREGWIYAGTPSFFPDKIKTSPPRLKAPPGHGGARE